MGGTALKLLIAGFFVWLSAQMGTFVDEILTRVSESVQASELLQIDGYVYYHSALENERTRAPRDQTEFESVVREWTEAPAGRDVTKDRWDRPLVYDHQESRDPREIHWRISSGGPDRKIGTDDDLVVVRDNDVARINRDPAKIAELAIERKEKLDRETTTRVRQVLELANQSPPPGTPTKDVTPPMQARELDDATHTLARLMDES